MRKNIILVIILVLITSKGLTAQIKFSAFGTTYPDYVEEVPETGALEPLEEVNDTILKKIMSGFRRTNMEEISEFLSPKLQVDIPMIDSLLNTYEENYLNTDSIYLKENSGFAVGEDGTTAITMYTHKTKGSLVIEYQYLRLSKIVVNKIFINGKQFPAGIDRIKDLEVLLRNRSLDENEKFMAYKELIELITPRQGQEINDFGLPQTSDKLSEMNGNMSWYALILGKNQLAVEAAEQGLLLNPNNKWINTNLALGLAQTGNIDRASEIYFSLKDEIYKERSFKEIFLADIEDLESKGIEVTYKEKIHEILNVE